VLLSDGVTEWNTDENSGDDARARGFSGDNVQRNQHGVSVFRGEVPDSTGHLEARRQDLLNRYAVSRQQHDARGEAAARPTDDTESGSGRNNREYIY